MNDGNTETNAPRKWHGKELPTCARVYWKDKSPRQFASTPHTLQLEVPYMAGVLVAVMAAIAAHSPEVKEQVKALYLQGFGPTRIHEMTGVKVTTIGQWSNRGRWMEIRSGSMSKIRKVAMTALTRETTRELEKASADVRDKLSRALSEQSTAISTLKAKKDVKSIKAAGEAIETLARSSKVVFGWSDGGKPGVILADLLSQDGPQSSVEVAAEVTREETPQESPQIEPPKEEPASPAV